eukprot:10835155-Lingulodinium_polyedra.AAC.1
MFFADFRCFSPIRPRRKTHKAKKSARKRASHQGPATGSVQQPVAWGGSGGAGQGSLVSAAGPVLCSQTASSRTEEEEGTAKRKQEGSPGASGH